MGLVILVVALIFLVWIFYKRSSVGKTIYVDHGKKSRVFRSKRHRIAAKPDRIVQGKNGLVEPHEFKSRKFGLFSRDITQIKTTVIALRDSGYNVDTAVLEVGSGKQYRIDIEPTDEIMKSDTGDAIRVVRSIKRGETPKATPSLKSCRGCSYRAQCVYSYK